mmetsp:Transcript_97626/g.173887  ORF Transcript_97626/g.173887 Transcript_97626/m.173887 type:complete len:127 (-) Transcript_97626:57-437(-)
MNAKLTSDGTGRDQYMIQTMRDFEANGRASLNGYRAQFKTTELRNYSYKPEPRRKGSNATSRSSIFSWEAHARGGTPKPPPVAPAEGPRLSAARRRQKSLCSRLSVPSDIHKMQDRFTVEGFMRGD